MARPLIQDISSSSSASVHIPCSSLIETYVRPASQVLQKSTLPLTFCRRVEMRFASLKLNASKGSPGSPTLSESCFSVTR